MRNQINGNSKVSGFVVHAKNLVMIKNILHSNYSKIKAIPIPVSDINDRPAWKSTTSGGFSITSATWTNNDKMPPHPRTKFLNSIGT